MYMSNYLIFSIAAGAVALLYGLGLARRIAREPAGDGKMLSIAAAIQEGARAYLNRQYRSIAAIGIVLFIILSVFIDLLTGIGFLIGGVASALAGYIGMNVSVRANVRTAEAAKKGLSQALSLAFRGGSVTGFLVVGLALLSVSGFYAITGNVRGLIGLGLGASLISVFARLGGGIFTKGADVGADLVGKVEAGIPEDDARNPAVIADNVGDNVGDCAGMAADLFETYLVTIVGTMLLGSIFFKGKVKYMLMIYPLCIGGISILTSIVGTFFVKLGKKNNIMGALYRGFIATAVLSAAAIGIFTKFFIGFNSNSLKIDEISFTGLNLFYCTLTGLVVTGLLMWLTEYYTSTKFKPVRSIAEASQTGHATNIIQGLAVSMKSTVLPVIVICFGILVAYLNAELYGIAIAATSMLSLSGMIIALASYGPVRSEEHTS